MFSIFPFVTLSVSVFTVVPLLVVGAVGTESLFVTGVSLYVFVLYSNSIMYFPAFNSLNSYLPSLSVIAVISFPSSPFRYSATLSLLICFIFTKIPFNNFSFSSFIPSSFSSSHAVPEILYVLSVGVSGLSVPGSSVPGLSGSSALVPFNMYSIVFSPIFISLLLSHALLGGTLAFNVDILFIVLSSSPSAKTTPLQDIVNSCSSLKLILTVYLSPFVLKYFIPLAKRYGAAILCLPLSDEGIPKTAKERLALAQKIIAEAKAHGLKDNDFLLDALVMTIAADKNACNEVLNTLKLYREHIGAPSTMGLSNISFGLPNRPLINSTFFTM